MLSFEFSCCVAVHLATLLVRFLLCYLKRFLISKWPVDIPIVLVILEKCTQVERMVIIEDLLGLYSLCKVTGIPLAVAVIVQNQSHIVGSRLDKVKGTSSGICPLTHNNILACIKQLYDSVILNTGNTHIERCILIK